MVSMRVSGLGLAMALLAGGLLAAPLPAHAAASRELVRLSLLDACVMGEWQARQDTSRIAEECKCAAQKAAGQLSPQQVAAYKNKLDHTGEAIWAAATKACFKSETASAKP
jgi:hypothetical protein